MSTRRTYKIAMIPGDGIGKEVLPIGRKVVDAACSLCDVQIDWAEFDWSCERYELVGAFMPADGIETLATFDAIYLGAVGSPTVPDDASLWGLLMPIRREFDLYLNIRPVRLLAGLASPLRDKSSREIDFVIVRENTEGEYSEIGGRFRSGTPQESVIQQAVFSRQGTDRVLDYAFSLANTRASKHLVSATKSNGIIHSMPYWDERCAAIGRNYPAVASTNYHIDALCALMVLNPERLDIVVASNLFGDILSDLGAAIAGSIGIAPSANINPDPAVPSMFEPIHGSAPDIVGHGIANPIGAVWAAAMMLDHLGEQEAANNIVSAVESAVCNDNARTADIGGTACSGDVLEFLLDCLARPGKSQSQ